MNVDDVPEKGIKDICLDSFQPDTWYAGCDERVFRSTNNGYSWELIAHFEGEEIRFVRSFPMKACTSVRHSGLLAVITKTTKHVSSIQISKDCGQIWATARQIQFPIEDFTWLDRDGLPYLLLATEKGVYELSLDDSAVPIPILVDPKLPKLGFRAITVSTSTGGILL